MKNIRYHIMAAAALICAVSCQTPEDIIPSVPGKGINAFTVYTSWEAYHTADKNGWGSVIDYDAHTITVQVPYTWPVASDNVQSLEELNGLWCQFNLDDNVYVEPSMMKIDLSKTYTLKVTDQVKDVSTWTLNASLVKSAECEIESFTIKESGTAAIVDKNSRKLMVALAEPLVGAHASYVLSPHATISPDPETFAFDCSKENPMIFTVTAQDGVTSSDWTLELSVPDKYKAGMRPGSGTLVWAKKMLDIDASLKDNTSGLAACGDYLVLNTTGQDATVIDAKNGNLVKTINLGACQDTPKGNAYMTSDKNGHIVICNAVPNDGSILKVYRMENVDSTPELFLETEMESGINFGWRISVAGDVYSDAVLSMAKGSGVKTPLFAEWRISDGTLVSPVPEYKTLVGATDAWTWKGDVVCSGTESNADYFACGYSSNNFWWVDGSTLEAKGEINHFTANEQVTSCDAVRFNNVQYALVSMETSFTWGASGGMCVYEASSSATFTGKVPIAYGSNEPPACLVYDLPRGDNGYGEYGARMAGGVHDNAYHDAVFQVSEDGFFLYAYFMFCNGYVGCVQFDCLAE